MAWEGIEGHDEIVAGMARAASRGRVAGAYLFIGEEGVGKSTFARRLARVLTCESQGDNFTACGRCRSCVQADAESHPDIDVVAKPEERATIPLDAFIGSPEHRMREGLCWRILLRPAIGQRKVAIILDADAISEEGANCLLKTLEEPPDASVLILVGTALERQLPTIRSRCKVIRFGGLPRNVVEQVLTAEGLGDPESRQQAAAASAGSLARARLLVDADVVTFRRTLFGLLAARPFRGVEAGREVMAIMEYFGSPEFANARQTLQKEAKGGGDVLSGFNTANLNVDRSLWNPLEQSFLEIMANNDVRFDGSDLMPADVGAGSFWTEGTALVNGEKTVAEAAAAIDATWPE